MSAYREQREQVRQLAEQLGAVIRESGDNRYRLWAAATDDLSDAVSAEDDLAGLREAFIAASREFWLRENELHSRKVPERPNLKVVKP